MNDEATVTVTLTLSAFYSILDAITIARGVFEADRELFDYELLYSDWAESLHPEEFLLLAKTNSDIAAVEDANHQLYLQIEPWMLPPTVHRALRTEVVS
jgi:hypothetical protein